MNKIEFIITNTDEGFKLEGKIDGNFSIATLEEVRNTIQEQIDTMKNEQIEKIKMMLKDEESFEKTLKEFMSSLKNAVEKGEK